MVDHTKNPRYYGNNKVNSQMGSPKTFQEKIDAQIGTRNNTYKSPNKQRNVTSGIYKITNDRTGETYIGQSKNIERKIKSDENELRQGTHNNRGMQSDYLKGDTFTSTILEKTSSDRETLHQKEEKYISQYNTFNQGYNQTPGGQYDKYQGYYGHGGGRLGSSTRQTSSYSQNNNYPNNYGNNVNYFGSDDEVIKCALFVGLILFGPLIFMNILFNTQFINFFDDSINYYAFIPLILFIIFVIILLMYIFSYGIFSKNKSNNSKKKRKTSKRVIKDMKTRECPKCGYPVNVESRICLHCDYKFR